MADKEKSTKLVKATKVVKVVKAKPAAKPKTRKRPLHEQGDNEIKMTVLDELEQAAQKRITGGKRIPLAAKLKLEWTNQEEGYNYQWATDSAGYPITLQQMLESGYTFVRHGFGQLTGQAVIQHSKGCKLYLMRCENKYFEEDQAIKHEKAIAQHKQITQVGDREYGGDSKELGKGKVASLSFKETPQDAIDLMTGGD